MISRRSKKRLLGVLPAAALGVALVGGCSGSGPAALGETASADPATLGGDFGRPFDTVPSSDGSKFYFTAMGSQGMGVYQVPASGGMATALGSGAMLSSPFGIAISGDDQTLFIADAAAGYDPNDPAGSDKLGAIFTMPAGGGTPRILGGTEGMRPRAIEVASDGGTEMLFFSGQGTDGRPGVFKIPVAGGAVTTLLSGDPLTDPGGVTIARDGTVYVANTTSPQDGSATVYQIKAGAATVVAGDLRAGYPAGIALSQNDGTLLVSGHDKVLGTDVVYRIKLADNSVGQFSTGIENNTDSGGLHRARSADVFAWADLTAGSGGAVYKVTFK